MTVDPRIALSNVRRELAECKDVAGRYGWKISYINEKHQFFYVNMISPLDNEKYCLRIQFDNYKSYPLLMEFVDPKTNRHGRRSAYPKSKGEAGSFFNERFACICHPCSRKAYREARGPHKDWRMSAWRQNPLVGTLTTLKTILLAIYSRISNEDHYGGRMSG